MTDFSSSNNISMNSPNPFQAKKEDLHKTPDFLRPALVHEHNISYQELKNEYVKALNYIDIIQLEKNNLLNTMKTVSNRRPDLNSASTNSRSLTSSKSSSQLKGVIMSQPLTDKKYIQLDQENRELKRLIAETKKPLRDLEDEKKIMTLEREVNDLRKTLEEKSERISFMQKEGRFHQEKIVETYQLERENKQFKSEIQYLNDELDSSKRKYKQLEEKNSKLVANDPNSSPLAQETNQNLMKSSGQLLFTINTFSANHFVRTCFEERFAGAVEVHRLLNTKDYATLLLKNYKYINDLLFNLSAPSMPTTTNIAPLSARGQNTDRLNESSLNRSGIRTQQQNSPTHKRKPSAGNERPTTPGNNLNLSIASNANTNVSRSRVNIQPQPILLNNNNTSINNSILRDKPSPISNNNNSTLKEKSPISNNNNNSILREKPSPISNNNTPSVRGYHSRALSQNIPQTNTGDTVLYETNSALNPKPQRTTFEEAGTPYDSVTMFDASKSSPAIHNQDRLRLKNLLSTSQPRDFRTEINNELKDRRTKIADISSPSVGRSSLDNDPIAEKEKLLKERERHLNEMERELKERDRELREKSREISEKRNNSSHNISYSTAKHNNNHNSTKDYMTFQKDTPSNYNSNQNLSKPSNESRGKSTPTPQLRIPLNQTVEHSQVQDNRDFVDSRYEESTYKHENDKSLRFTPIAHETSGVHKQVEDDYRRDYIRGGSIGGESLKGDSVRIETGERFETRGLGDLPSTARDYKRRDDSDGSPLRRMNQSRNKSISISHYEQQQQQQQQQQSIPSAAETRVTGKSSYARDRVQPWELQERDYQPLISTARELRYNDDDDSVYQNQNQYRNRNQPQPHKVDRIDDYNNSRLKGIENFSPNSASNGVGGGYTNRNYEDEQETEHIADQTQNNHITFENQDDDEEQQGGGYDLPQYENDEYNEYSSRHGLDNSKSYSSRQRGTSSPTDYPTFRVAFGRTESKARFSSPQDPNGSVLDLQKKKRVGHLHSTYDVIRGEEARYEAKEAGDRLRYEYSPTKVLARAASTHNVHLQSLGSPVHSHTTSITPSASARHMEH